MGRTGSAQYGLAGNGSHELHLRECVELLASGTVGRVAIGTPRGPHIVPVNYVVDRESVVFRTSPYGVLGRSAWPCRLAFEVDEIDPASSSGWSVVANGLAERLDDPVEIGTLRAFRDPQPWADGIRRMYVRLPWDSLTGRRVGAAPGRGRAEGS